MPLLVEASSRPPLVAPALTSRRLRWAALGVSGALHLLLLVGLLLRPGLVRESRPEPSAHLRFVKAAPPRQRPLTRRALAAPAQRPLVRRQQTHAVPDQAARPEAATAAPGQRSGTGGGSGEGSGEGWGPGTGEGGGSFFSEGAGGLGESLPQGNGLGLGGGAGIGPGLRAGTVDGQRAGADEIDLGIELLGVEALDTGRERAVVIVDPRDRRKLKGFLYLSSVRSESIERAELQSSVSRRQDFTQASPVRQIAEREALQGLADRMTERTGVRTRVLDGLPLDDPRLLQVPFLLLTVSAPFTFTEAEAANLGRYLCSGGFLFAEVVRPLNHGVNPSNDTELDIPALRALIRTAFRQAGRQEGKDWSFVVLPMDHPLFHCYYEINSLPRGFRDIWFWYWSEAVKAEPTPAVLEGVVCGDQVVGVYSLKNYSDFWSGLAEKIHEENRAANYKGVFDVGGEWLKPYDLGVNILVYALTREGSLAKRLVAAE